MRRFYKSVSPCRPNYKKPLEFINKMKEFESVPFYDTSSTNSSAWQSQNKISGNTLEGGFDRFEFIECGTPPEEEAPEILRSIEKTAPLHITDQLCHSTIRAHLMEHMSMMCGRIQLLLDIESKKIVHDNIEEAFKSSSKQEKNISFLWSAFMKRWDLLEDLIRLGTDLNYYEPNQGLSALHLVSFSDCIPGAQFLIAQGCEVNAIHKCYAPLHCAAFGDSLDVAMILLQQGANVQALTRTRFNSQESVLHCAVRANSVACIRLFTHEGGDVGQVEFAGMSPVHLAAELGRTQCLRILLEVKGVNVNARTKDKEQTALHLAAENNHAEVIQVLLEKGANADIKNHMSQTPLHLATRAKAYLCVELLLDGHANPNIEDCDRRIPLHTAIGRSFVSCDIIDILIKYGAHVNRRDQFGYTPLHVAALNGLSQCVEVLIQHGADVTTKSKCGMTPLGIMRRKIPASLSVIKKKLNSAITLYQSPDSVNNEVDLRIDFRCILQHSYPREISFLNTFVDEGQKELLMHPLCSAFLYLKWRKIRKYYIARMFFCFIFVLSLSLYVLTALARNCYNMGKRRDYITGEDDVMELCEKNSVLGKMLRANPFVVEMQWFLLVGITVVEILRKLYGLSGYKTVKQYFSYPENILEWIVIVSVFVISFVYTGRTYMWQNHVGAFAVLFSWTNLMLMIGQLPVFGSYVAMYTKIQAEFGKLLLAYSCLLIGFAISFCVMFPDSSTFANPFIALISAIVMMTGELNLDILVDVDPDNPPLYLEVSAQITFTLFVLFVTVVLMNLLVGIAVDDIQGLQKTAGLSKLVRQTKLISHIEQALFSGNLPQIFLKWLHWSALVSPRAYRVILNVKPLNHREKRLPREILEAAHQIAKNNLEQMSSNSFTEEKSATLDSTKNWSLLQNSIDKKDQQFQQLKKEIKELKGNINGYQKTVEQLMLTISQSRGSNIQQ